MRPWVIEFSYNQYTLAEFLLCCSLQMVRIVPHALQWGVPEVIEYYIQVREAKIQQAAEQKKKEAEWFLQNAGLAAKLDKFFSDKTEFDFSAIEQKAGSATRAA